ncbi:MAG: PIN domain-containing protein [Acidobacteriaceae bacterium]
MNALAFVDSNVLVYWVDGSDPAKQQRASLWIGELWKDRSGRISFQVLQEFFFAATKRRPEVVEKIRAEVRNLLAWHPVSIDPPLLELAWKIQDRYHLSFWDSLIVAAAKAASCRWLLTEDLQAGQTIDGITVINPFQRTPDQLPV